MTSQPALPYNVAQHGADCLLTDMSSFQTQTHSGATFFIRPSHNKSFLAEAESIDSSDVGLHPLADATSATRHTITRQWRGTTTTSSQSEVTPADSVVDLEKERINNPLCSDNSLQGGIATKQELDRIAASHTLPPKPASKIGRGLRWGFFSEYRRLFAFVLALNMIAVVVFLVLLKKDASIATYGNAATAASTNFCVGVLMRNEHVVNLSFRIACIFPLGAPLWVRTHAAKVYHYGGIHSACGVSGSVWYLVFSALVITQFDARSDAQTALAITTGITLTMLSLILTFALPSLRAHIHNHFEATHRFGGWTAIACLWVQTMVLVSVQSLVERRSYGKVLVRTPPFWFLLIITCCLVYPWTRLRKRTVRVEHLSHHATRLHFEYCDMQPAMAVRLTDTPLMETHAFATIPNYRGTPGFSIIISNAGDWTNKLITNPPSSIWIKGAPTLGVIRVALMFKKVLVIGTGSGIGPCLSFLQSHPDNPMRVIWSAQSPETTYGRGIINAVFRADPDAIIVDTKKTGRPDLVALAYSIYKESGAEAVIVISNPTVTKKVVYGFESRGVAAYGAIFDS